MERKIRILIDILERVLTDRDQEEFEKYYDILAWSIVVLFGLIYAFMSVNKHYQFQTYGWDLAIFDHGVWQWSNLRIPYSNFHELPWLADHFHLILVLLAPFYWIYSGAETLLIMQAVLTVLGAIPLYYLSKRITKHYLFSIAIVVSFVTFYSLQWHTFSGFHELAFLPVTLGGVVYFWAEGRKRLYWLFVILALLVKEEIGLLIAAFGVWAFLKEKERRKEALITIILGILTTSVLIGLIMPAIGKGEYRHLGYGKLGDTPIQVLMNILKDPLIIPKTFVDSDVKMDTMLVTFWPWAFLPVFSPATLIPAAQQFLVRFLDYGKQIRWTPYFAYSLPMATLMGWGSIHGFRNILDILRRKFKNNTYLLGSIISLILFILVLLEDVLLHAPINSLFKPQFYRQEAWMEDNRKVIECLPENVSVSAQNNLAPWVSQRHKIKVFPEGIGYDYILVDLHPGLDENAFHFLGSEKTKFVISDLLDKKYYSILCQEGDSIVLKKNDDFTKKDLNYPFKIEIWEK